MSTATREKEASLSGTNKQSLNTATEDELVNIQVINTTTDTQTSNELISKDEDY